MNSLYREIIIDHYKNPRNFGRLEKPDIFYEKDNPFCGDRIRIELKSKNEKVKTTPNQKHSFGSGQAIKNLKIEEIKFSGEGCAISMASASMLTEKVRGGRTGDLKRLTKNDIVKMLGIELTPTRLKCALLPLEVLQRAIR